MAGPRAVLTPRPNSFKCTEKNLDLAVPIKIGRSNKEDKSSQDNGYFDCKVLSKPHALLLHQGGQFYLLDTGSSNGTFVNNVRLSKPGEESELTEIFTGDILRFGSDVVDRSRNVTQKCVVVKIYLTSEDGSEFNTRPASSRLYRPSDGLEDLQTVTKNLQESLSRERLLEERLSQILNLVQNNKIGNNIQDEISKIVESCGSNQEERKKFEAMRNDKALLRKENRELEEKLQEKEKYCVSLERKGEEDSRNISSLGAIIHRLRQDISNLENVVKSVKETQEKVSKDYETKMGDERRMYEEELDRIWRKDKERENEKMRLEERVMFLMHMDQDSSRSSVASTPTTIRQLGDNASLSGMSTPLHMNRSIMEDDEVDEEPMSLETLKEKAEMLDSVKFELEVTKQELEMVQDENGKIRREMAESHKGAKKNDDVFKNLHKSREEIQYLLSKVSEKDDLIESMFLKSELLETENSNLKSQAMINWVDSAESDFETVFQETCLNKPDQESLNAAIKLVPDNRETAASAHKEEEPNTEILIEAERNDKNIRLLIILISILAVFVSFIVYNTVYI